MMAITQLAAACAYALVNDLHNTGVITITAWIISLGRFMVFYMSICIELNTMVMVVVIKEKEEEEKNDVMCLFVCL